MIAAFLLGEGGGSGRPEEGSLSLGWLASRRLGGELPDRDQLMGKGGKKSDVVTWDQVEMAAAGACTSACVDATARLREIFEPELDEKAMKRLFEGIEMPLVSVLAHMELNGVA